MRALFAGALCVCASLIAISGACGQDRGQNRGQDPAQESPGGAAALSAQTSWIGNTFGYGDGTWTQINMTAIAVAPDGKVYTDAPWDESGAESGVYQDGKMLGYANGTHGWGNGGGNAVAVNRRYAFIAVSVNTERDHLIGKGVWPQKGHIWYGVSRREIGDPQRTAPFQPVANATDPRARLAASLAIVSDVAWNVHNEVTGLAANDKVLYVATAALDRVDIYDPDSMMRKGSFKAHEPGHLALAPDGSLWVLTDTLSGKSQLAHYSASGEKLDDSLPLPSDSVPADVTVDAQGRVLVADNGPRQQVLFFSRQNGRYTASGSLGERGGIFSGVAGRPGPQRFNGLTGVGVDGRGNIYVSTNGIGPNFSPPGSGFGAALGAGLGATLESYAPDGKRLWQVQGLLFVDGAWIDPARPNSVYTGNKRFELDLSKPAGQQWTYVGFLSNRFKYPEDPVFHTDQWPGMPIARQLKGHTFLYLTDMYADHLKIYRFDAARDGETAIPSAFFGGRGMRDPKAIPAAPPGGDWIWRDANGNGRFDDGEFARNTTGKRLVGGWGWWVDTAGDVWRTVDSHGIYRFHFGGLDKAGNPIYSYDDMQAYDVPAPFTQAQRAIYDASTDSLYVTGYTEDTPPQKQQWKEVGRVLVRYDKWSSGKPVARYTMKLPWDTNAKPIFTIIGLTVEGKYIFAVEPAGVVHVYDKDSSKELGVLRPGPEVGRASGWVDVANGVSAARRSDGEYLVFVEEDARGKVTMYRWKPS
ncbi:NHL repeat-containing protein [Paraburkholderia sp. 2C]